jgi:alcohol dehydrogenase (NADP+)
MKMLKYRNGDEMPQLGLGTWKASEGEVYNAVIHAVELGYRHIDCAFIYGNQNEIGEALDKVFKDGIARREELWITSKLWNDSHRPEHVTPALRETLSELKLQYLDLYLIHWPVAFENGSLFPGKREEFLTLEQMPISETWRGMEECALSGLTKHIGVSNFSQKKLEALVSSSKWAPEVNQIELHPLLQQNELKSYCDMMGIHLTAYSPLGSAKPIHDKGYRLLDHPELVELASKNNCSVAQLLIAWAMQRGTSVIPKSVNPGRLKQNWEAQFIDLSQEDMHKLANMDAHYRFVDGKFWTERNGSPYTLEGLWDE